MNAILLYFVLLKAVVTSFSGLASLPMLRNDLVLHYQVLTDRELNTAVAVGRSGPGPIGLYVVSVGYFVAGVPGACAGMLATVTPAFLIVPVIRYLGRRADSRRARGAIQAVMLAASGLMVSSTLPLVRDSITGPVALAIAVTSFAVLSFTKLDNVWVILGSAAAGMLGKWAA